MIPTIETIVEDLLAGTISKQQALAWLFQHAEDAGRDLRDDFAAAALAGLLPRRWGNDDGVLPSNIHELWAKGAYQTADAMLKERTNAR